jgi:serine protease Do
MIQMRCACGKDFQIPEKFKGRQGRCPNCSAIIVVPNELEDIPIFEEVSQSPQPFSTHELFEHVVDSVVSISHEGRIYGSGVLIDSNGVVATNHHVVSISKKVMVLLNNGTEHLGELIRSYRDVDLAFLQVLSKPDKFASLADKDKLKIGQTIYAIGHPMGLQNTITKGIISAINRKIRGGKYLQTDASINPGNSGGPLFNEYAEVVGINTMMLQDAQGLGFAIPIEIVAERYESIKQNWSSLFTKEYCGICGKNSGYYKYCEHCGVELNTSRPSKTIRPLKRLASTDPYVRTKQCKVCNAAVSVTNKYCHVCGVTMPGVRPLR